MPNRLNDLPIRQEELRKIVLDCLKTVRGGPKDELGFGNFDFLASGVAYFAATKGIVPDPNGPDPSRHAVYWLSERDWGRLQDIYWDLLIEGVIRPGWLSDMNSTLSNFHVTEQGRAIMSAGSPTPYDPDGYLSRIRGRLPSIDLIILTYLEESLRTFRIGCLLASTGTLGCASEKALLVLIEAYANAMEPARQTRFRAAIEGKFIKGKFDEFKKQLEGHLRGHLKPVGLADRLDTLTGVFDMIRRQRNDAGHPTGVTMDRAECYANLMVFPDYLDGMYAVIDWLNRQAAGSLN